MAFKDSTDEKFQDQINGSKLNLIQFSASWCGPCQQLKPIIEKISNDMPDKIDCYYHDIESQPNEPTKYSVRGVPTVLLFKGGKLVGTKVGSTSEKAARFLSALHECDCYSDKEAIESDLAWLKSQGFKEATSSSKPIEPPPINQLVENSLGGWHQMAEKDVFIRIMTLIRYVLQNPFDLRLILQNKS